MLEALLRKCHQGRPLCGNHLGWYMKDEKEPEMGRENSEGKSPKARTNLTYMRNKRKYTNSVSVVGASLGGLTLLLFWSVCLLFLSLFFAYIFKVHKYSLR